jgi:hypothetical protein
MNSKVDVFLGSKYHFWTAPVRIGTSGFSKNLFGTIRGLGYQLIVRVAEPVIFDLLSFDLRWLTALALV